MGLFSRHVLFCSRKTIRFGATSFSVSPYRLLYDADALPGLFRQLKVCRSVLLVFSKDFVLPSSGENSVLQQLRLPVVDAGFSDAFKQRLRRSDVRVRAVYVQLFDWLYVPVSLSTLMWRVAAPILAFWVVVGVTCALDGWRMSQRIVGLGEWQQGISTHLNQRWQQMRISKGQVGAQQKVLDQYHWLRTLPLTLAALRIRKDRGTVSGLISKTDWRRMEKQIDIQRFGAFELKNSTVDLLPSGVLQCKLVFRF